MSVESDLTFLRHLLALLIGFAPIAITIAIKIALYRLYQEEAESPHPDSEYERGSSFESQEPKHAVAVRFSENLNALRRNSSPETN